MPDRPASESDTEQVEPGTEQIEEALGSPWEDLRAYIRTPRLGGLTLSPDGATLLVSVSAIDEKETAYRTALWRVDTAGQQPARRWTRSVQGDSAAAFLADGSLLFTSKRDAPEVEGADPETSGVLWCLPAGGGEAYVAARRDGGWGAVVAARAADTVVLETPTHTGAGDEEADAEKRAFRKKNKINAILHEGYPVRFWDHDLGPEQPRLVATEATELDGDHLLDVAAARQLTGEVGRAVGQSKVLSTDGTRLLVDWQVTRPQGEVVGAVASIDTTSGERTILAGVGAAEEDLEHEYGGAVISDDGALIACNRERVGSPERAHEVSLWMIDATTGAGRPLAPDWDVWAHPIAFSPDNSTLYVGLDEQGHSPVYAVDVASGERRRLTGEGAFSSVLLSPDGSTLYAVRTSYTDPGSIVAVDTTTATTSVLPAPHAYPELPGRLEDVATTAADGTRIRGYLAVPAGASATNPAPLAVWIHGGPVSSWNAWSWRWCPWLLVSRGYAVLLPDPALSTGYGQEFIQRGWGEWGDAPYTDLMDITDAVEARDDIDGDRTVAMGGSFGGYMANWVAGHTDRFSAIVTHASLWNLESFGPTTDAAWFWSKEMSPQMQQRNSPHRFADQISTPMLVIHGDKDYRVPISEGLALWWALVQGFDGPPEDLPHKFLYFPDENHWVLTPQHAKVWYETVLAFLETHLGDGNFVRPDAL